MVKVMGLGPYLEQQKVVVATVERQPTKALHIGDERLLGFTRVIIAQYKSCRVHDLYGTL